MNILLFLKNILQLILSPINGWKDIDKESVEVEVLMQRGLYPLMAVMLLSVFIRPVYGLMDFDLVKLLQTALVQFVALFVALFAARNVIEHYLPMYNYTGDKDPIAAGTVAVYGTGLMAVIQIIENVIPIQLTVIQLLPAFAAVCIWNSHNYLDVDPERETQFMLICTSVLIVPVIVINVLMSFLIN